MAGAPTVMSVNGIDLSAYDLWVETPEGFLHAPERIDEEIPTRQAGAFVTPSAAKIGARRWSVNAVLIATSSADAQAKWDAIKLLLSDVWLEVMFQPFTDRMLWCRYQGLQALATDLNLPGWR